MCLDFEGETNLGLRQTNNRVGLVVLVRLALAPLTFDNAVNRMRLMKPFETTHLTVNSSLTAQHNATLPFLFVFSSSSLRLLPETANDRNATNSSTPHFAMLQMLEHGCCI